MAKRDYYDVLNVARDASNDDIKRAYRKLAMKYHPDRNPDAADAPDRFKEASEAYEVLSSADKRQRYDQFGHEGVEGSLRGGFSFANGSFEDIFGDLNSVFGDMFGGARQRTRNAPQAGHDLQYRLEVDLETAVFGAEEEIAVAALRNCDACDGSGAAPGSRPERCGQCNGSGQVGINRGFFQMRQTCPACRGAGEVISEPCRPCRGQGRVERERTIKLKVPAGVDTNTRIRMQGKGEDGPNGGPAGDLYVLIEVAEHAVFQRDGVNLHCDVVVNVPQAALGDEIEVPTLDGKHTLRIPAGTQSGREFRIRGVGVPGLRTRGRGDLLCRVVVETPISLNDEQQQLMRDLWESLDGDPDHHSPKRSNWLSSIQEWLTR